MFSTKKLFPEMRGVPCCPVCCPPEMPNEGGDAPAEVTLKAQPPHRLVWNICTTPVCGASRHVGG